MLNFRANFSRGVLWRLVLLGGLAVAALYLNRDFLLDIYVRNQPTRVGIVINSLIVLMFLLGLSRIVDSLIRYAREESWLAKFAAHIEGGGLKPTQGIPRESIIYQRYAAILKISKQHAPINHGALASTLVARESTRVSFPKFINNILILIGVFGTIVSLSIALLGASNLLKSMDQAGNMDLVVHGMATALSTTMTAIVCYLFFGYFYLKLTDAQTHLLSAVEQVTAIYLMPRHATDLEGVINRVADVVRAMREALHGMQAVQADYALAGGQLREAVAGLKDAVSSMVGDVGQIKTHLREGFRLPNPEE